MDKYKALTSQGAAAYLNTLEEIGWFSFPHNNKAKISEHLFGISSSEYFFYVLSHIVRDAEGFEEGSDYKELFEEMAALSGVNVVAAEFEYEMIGFGEDELTGTVVTENGNYNCELGELMGWLDADFIEGFVNEEVLPGEGIEGRFFMLPATDQMAQYTYATQEVYDKAIAVGLLPDDAEYFMSGFDQ